VAEEEVQLQKKVQGVQVQKAFQSTQCKEEEIQSHQ
jgi:hypothetical protein